MRTEKSRKIVTHWNIIEPKIAKGLAIFSFLLILHSTNWYTLGPSDCALIIDDGDDYNCDDYYDCDDDGDWWY